MKLPFLTEFEEALEALIIPEYPSGLYDPVRYILLLGGKRIRPLIVLNACGMAKGNPQEAMPAAIAVELLHNFTLIHDDIMDKADSRRGQPTVHKKWDESVAILSGDVMFNMAYEQLFVYAQTEYGLHRMKDLLTVFGNATRIVCEGQASDMEFEKRLDVAVDEYLDMIGAKTAALLQASFQMGGIVAGASEQKIEILGTLGREAGVAFQIQDDLLDAIADPKDFGKKKGGDIYEGKKTFLSLMALQRAENETKEKLSSILQNDACTQQEVSYVTQLYYDLGVIEETEKAINNRYITCLSALEHFEDGPFKSAVVQLIESLRKRKS
ncbi:MAG: polyprenyl synthetase family protein [Balneolales bacterium]|nr:polyprenyl synthetase family protein [Balneolales bacterium]